MGNAQRICVGTRQILAITPDDQCVDDHITDADPEFQLTSNTTVEILNAPKQPDPKDMDKETYGYGSDDSISTFHQVDNKLQQQLAEVTSQAATFVQKVGGTSSLVSPVYSLTLDTPHLDTQCNQRQVLLAASVTSTLDSTVEGSISNLKTATLHIESTLEQNSIMLHMLLHKLESVFSGKSTDNITANHSNPKNDQSSNPNDMEVVTMREQYKSNPSCDEGPK